MNWIEISREVLKGGLTIAVLVTAIIVPISVGFALLRDSRLLDRIAEGIHPVMHRFGLSDRAAFPLVAGLLLGVVFGAGVLLSFSKDSSLTKRDLVLVLVFLSVCHSLIEDTVIFVALGANAWVLVPFRFVLAFSATFLVACILGRRHAPGAG